MSRISALISIFLIAFTCAVAAASVSVVVGPRVGLVAGKDIMLPGAWAGYFDIGAKCDVVFEMCPFKGYLAVTPTFDYLLNLEYPAVVTVGLSAKVRYPHRRFIPYGFFGGLFYSEGPDISSAGGFRSAFGEQQLGIITILGGGCDIRLGKWLGVNGEFQALDFGTYIGVLGGASIFL